MFNRLKEKLQLPEVAHLCIDDPSLTEKRRDIIKRKGLLSRIYTEWYETIAAEVPSGPGEIIELGAGGGFLKEFIPELVTTDVFPCLGVDKVMDGCKQWPYAENQLKAVLMVDVLHHLPDVNSFFQQAETAVKSNGVIAMIEPWVTPWSQLVYTKLHHEPFVPSTTEWAFPASGPLSSANSALPWILFQRDREIFEQKFPMWKIEKVSKLMPYVYLLSGGVSMRSLLPGWLYNVVRATEKYSGMDRGMAMFAFILLRRT